MTDHLQLLNENIDEINKGALKSAETLRKRLPLLEKIQEALGREIIKYRWDLNRSTLTIEESELPKIRKVVGKLQVGNKFVSSNYDENQSIFVTVRPVKKEFSALISFQYKKKYKGQGKCRVVKQVFTEYNLVCDR